MADENVLQHAARRRVIRSLLDADGRADVGALVGAQVAASDDSFVEAVTALHDLHVPKLEAAGLVEDPDGETVVSLAVPPEEARARLEAAD